MEEIAMMMILHAGDANRMAFEALRKVKSRDFDEAKDLIEKAQKKSLESHAMQTNLLQKMATGEKVEMTILLTHAQDHLMNSVLVIDLVEEMIEVFKSYS